MGLSSDQMEVFMRGISARMARIRMGHTIHVSQKRERGIASGILKSCMVR